MSAQRILIVEDDASIAEFIRIGLDRAGFKASAVHSTEAALQALVHFAADLVVLDISLPGMDGLSLCRHLRAHQADLAIILVTARGTDFDKILGLEMGADDYLVKPFNPQELIARIRSVLRRVQPAGRSAEATRTALLQIDPAARRVIRRGQEVHLTAREFDVLQTLAQHSGQVVTRADLLREVWGEDFFGDEKTLDVHIRRLREKLEDDPAQPTLLTTVRSVGFRFDPPE